MTHHKSTAFLPMLSHRDKVTDQFRWVIRACVAAHEAGLPYDVAWWQLLDKRAAVTFAAASLPATFRVKALPKPPAPRLIGSWKPRMFEAEYRLNAYLGKEHKFQPGFVVAHSCGLSLVRPSPDGEWPEDDARKGWKLTHTASGKGFGIEFSFERGVRALLAIANGTDWTMTIEQLAAGIAARRAHAWIRATYGKGWDKREAHQELTRLDRAPASLPVAAVGVAA